MGDVVQQILEEMVPELQDLERKGIFSSEEIKAIVKKRTNFEYLLRRRAPLKADFIRYAQYELQLEELRALRRARLQIESKPGAGDFGMIRRIHFIFERALRKFKGDVRLWLQYIDFCRKQGSSKVLGKTFARALQLHPTKPGLWIAAASWEFESNNNIQTARVLLQRALRINPAAQKLWHEYCRLELLYVYKVAERRRILGIDGGDDEGGRGGAGPAGAASIDVAAIPGGEGDGADDLGLRKAERGETSKRSDAQRRFLAGAVPCAVYRNAAAAVPGDVPFRLRFAEMARDFDGIGRQLEQDEAWDALARRGLRGGPADWWDDAAACSAAETTFRRACDAVGTEGMHERALAFHIERARAAREEEDAARRPGPPPCVPARPPARPSSLRAAPQAAALLRGAGEVHEAAAAAGRASEALRRAYAQLLLDLGHAAEAETVAAAATAAAGASAAAWLLRADAMLARLAAGPSAASASASAPASDSEASTPAPGRSRAGARSSARKGRAAPSPAPTPSGGPAASSSSSSAHGSSPLPTASDVLAVLEEGIRRVPPDGAGPLWQRLLEVCTDPRHAADPEAVQSAFLRASRARCGGSLLFKEKFLEWSFAAGGADALRSAYQRLLERPPVEAGVHRAALGLLGEREPRHAELPRLFELAVVDCPHDTVLWLLYVTWLRKGVRDHAKANTVHWRAMKALPDTAAFSEAYAQLIAS
eukprot:tig00000571_g2183.t1